MFHHFCEIHVDLPILTCCLLIFLVDIRKICKFWQNFETCIWLRFPATSLENTLLLESSIPGHLFPQIFALSFMNAYKHEIFKKWFR